MASEPKEGIAAFLKPGELHSLSRLVLMSRYVVEGNLAGVHRSPQRGSSTEFADHRAYIQGDDPRFIDWKVFGRTDRYYVRQYENETNLRVYLVLDRSASMGYGSGARTKYDMACHLAAAFGYVVVKARDSVGLFLHADKIDVKMEARNSFLHLNNMLKQLQRHKPGNATALGQTLHQVAEAVHKRALIVVLSDLFGETEEIVHALAHFRKQHHDVVLCHVLDPMELDLAFKRAVLFEDMETGEEITVDAQALAPEYRRVFGEFLDGYRRACAQMNIDYRLIKTDHDIEAFVRAYLDERRRLSR